MSAAPTEDSLLDITFGVLSRQSTADKLLSAIVFSRGNVVALQSALWLRLLDECMPGVYTDTLPNWALQASPARPEMAYFFALAAAHDIYARFLFYSLRGSPDVRNVYTMQILPVQTRRDAGPPPQLLADSVLLTNDGNPFRNAQAPLLEPDKVFACPARQLEIQGARHFSASPSFRPVADFFSANMYLTVDGVLAASSSDFEPMTDNMREETGALGDRVAFRVGADNFIESDSIFLPYVALDAGQRRDYVAFIAEEAQLPPAFAAIRRLSFAASAAENVSQALADAASDFVQYACDFRTSQQDALNVGTLASGRIRLMFNRDGSGGGTAQGEFYSNVEVNLTGVLSARPRRDAQFMANELRRANATELYTVLDRIGLAYLSNDTRRLSELLTAVFSPAAESGTQAAIWHVDE